MAPSALRAAVAVLGLVLVAVRAHALDPVAPGLNWVRLPGAESCISAQALAAAVEERVGRVLFVAIAEAGLTVDGSVERGTPDGWHVILDVSDPAGRVLGRRVLHFAGDDCAVIDDSITLVIAVTLYPNTGLIDAGIPLDPETASKLETLFGDEPSELDPASLPPARPATRQPSAEDARANRSAREGERVPNVGAPWRIGLDAAGVGGLGQLPVASLGASGFVSITAPGAWPFELGVVVLPGYRVAAADELGEARFSLLAGSLSLCPFQPAWLHALAICLGGEVGRLRGEPSGFAWGEVARNDLIASLTGRARWQPELTRALHLRLAVLLALPLIQRTYTFQAPDGRPQQLFRMPQVAAGLELGLGIFF
ncbi:MAG TPA: hypothetical protein VK524_01510 [Polyangiaceae bacterium]|nr:hypothetical protein [Polyangiaceae bacterium]